MTTTPTPRIEIDSEDVARGFAELVIALAELIRELLERQAIRRIDAGDLTDSQIERLGTSLLRMKTELDDLRSAVSRNRTERGVR
jgi:gas vesicle protein GvpK